MAIHHFHLKAGWEGGRNSEGRISCGKLESKVSIPKSMGGPGAGTNPDEMLLGAAATCFLITLAAMLERSNVTVAPLTLESEALVDVTDNVFTYKEITHRPTIVFTAVESPELEKKVERLAHKAEASCMITRALKGNVEVKAEPIIKWGIE
ncbi:OsmC family protein [Aureibacillus halotolerans]|uniref:Peroxiredoxin-like protein n=1 Tax=Aureibacillus halotolerans TaxID=1508390 RepID=A0A4R6U8U6_9BACI|nr:OsmC family protein [Aureibacillus halotolerans]TDQ42831.1 peroxiredoxin-like protein [Aureibacillus halotolerans]